MTEEFYRAILEKARNDEGLNPNHIKILTECFDRKNVAITCDKAAWIIFNNFRRFNANQKMFRKLQVSQEMQIMCRAGYLCAVKGESDDPFEPVKFRINVEP